MPVASAIYAGSVVHRRFWPKRHRLRYRCFWLLLDLDEVDEIAKSSWLFGHNRCRVYSFRDRDHGDGLEKPLRPLVEQRLADAGIDIAGGAIRLLCMPRVLGYGFNPLSIYFCHHADGRLLATIYEVSNTFGERHSYLIPVDPENSLAGEIRQAAEKAFYVSPFLDQELTYHFRLERPGARIRVAVEARSGEGLVLNASLSGERRPLDDAGLARLLATHPLLTLKVITAIHWEALRLIAKRIGMRPRPPPPHVPVTTISTTGPREHHDHR
jgi:DUF1365 family protein